MGRMGLNARCLVGAVLCASALQGTQAAADGRLRDVYEVAWETGVPATPVRIAEGVAFDPLGGDFFATGLFGGRITRIDAGSGDEQTFFQDAPTMAFIGIKVAPLRRVAWVCVVDTMAGFEQPVSFVYAIGISREGEGQLIRAFELPTPFFCNDLALDFQGDAYVTDWVGSAIVHIDARGLWDPTVAPDVFIDSPLLAPVGPGGPPIGFATAMNGIAVTPDNQYVLVARNAPTQLLRISRTNPDEILPVVADGDGLAEVPDPNGGPPLRLGIDGLVFIRGDLYMVAGIAVQRLDFARGSDYLQATSSTLLGLSPGLTTATRAYGELYVIDAEVHAALPVPGIPVELPHTIVRIDRDAF